MSPVRFSVGDIVEEQFVFLLIPVARNKYRMQTVLQSVTLLNNTFSQVWSVSGVLVASDESIQLAHVAQVAKSLWPTIVKPPISIKRRIGYQEEEAEVAEARRKMARMDIDKVGGDHAHNGNATPGEEQTAEQETVPSSNMCG